MTRIVDQLRAAALDAAARGWAVFPLRAPRAAKPKRPAWGLHSLEDCARTGYCRAGHLGWEQLATADPDRVRRCWSPDTCRLGSGVHNIGLPAGRNGLLVIDCDVPKPGEQNDCNREGVRDGLDVLAILAEEAGERPPLPGDTFTVTTPSGGTHLYYRAPSGVDLHNTAGKLGWKVDTRGHGGYVVAPGSLITTPGGTRAYDVLADVPVADLPGWITRRLRERPRAAPSAPRQVALEHVGRYVAAAVRRESERVAAAPRGQHSSVLYTAAIALGQLVAGGSLPPATAEIALTQAASSYLAGDCDCTSREITRTIRNGLRDGAKRPRAIA